MKTIKSKSKNETLSELKGLISRGAYIMLHWDEPEVQQLIRNVKCDCGRNCQNDTLEDAIDNLRDMTEEMVRSEAINDRNNKPQ